MKIYLKSPIWWYEAECKYVGGEWVLYENLNPYDSKELKARNIKIGDNVELGNDVYIDFDVRIGNEVQIGNDVKIESGVRIGNNTVIGNIVRIDRRVKIDRYIQIGNDVDIRDNVRINFGVKIGNRVIIKKNTTIFYNVTIGSDVEIAEHTKIRRSPIYIIGSKGIVAECGHELLQIDYKIHPIEYWLENYARLGKENNYTKEEIKEYGAHIKYAAGHMTIKEVKS